MSAALKLTVSGAGIASIAVPRTAVQITAVLAVAGATDALDVQLYVTPTKPSGSIPAGSQEIGEYKAAIGACLPANLGADGVDAQGFIAADFIDVDTAHSLYVYYK